MKDKLKLIQEKALAAFQEAKEIKREKARSNDMIRFTILVLSEHFFHYSIVKIQRQGFFSSYLKFFPRFSS